MLVGLAVLFISQFFSYCADDSYGIMTMDAEFNTHGTYWLSTGPVGTGWQLHAVAPYLFAVFAFIYFTVRCETAYWRRWGYLLTVILAFGCLAPGAWVCGGFKLGLAGYGLMIWAVARNRSDRNKSAVSSKL